MNQTSLFSRNVIHQGDCISVMRRMPTQSVDFILTDPPYLVRYQPRDGRRIINDDNGRWLGPAARGMFRVLKNDSLGVSFYGWSQTDRFMGAWRAAGFQIVGHIVFRKKYASASRRQLHARIRLYAGQGPPRFAGEPSCRCYRIPLHGKPAASNAEAGGHPEAPDRGVLPGRRAGAGPVLRFGIDPCRGLRG